MSSLPAKELILDNFSQFFSKLIQSHPLHDDLIQQLTSFRKIINNDSDNYIQTKTFIHSLYQRSVHKTELSPANESQTTPSVTSTLSTDSTLKIFTSEKFKYPFSLLTKFTYTSFKDYLSKNSILMPPDSSVRDKYSHVREFLPDSQNFYRALGLGILEGFLSKPILLPRIAEWYNKIFNRELSLSTQLYPFNSDELRSIFCGYLKQLAETREASEETTDGIKSRRLLYQMDSKDTVFDIALISFVKEMIMDYYANASRNKANTVVNRMKANDSSVISDLLEEIPNIFTINLVVLTIQSRASTEVFYDHKNSDQNKASPRVYIMNEKQLSYQNFCVLNIDNLDLGNSESSAEKSKLSGTHTRNYSVQFPIPSNSISTVHDNNDKNYSTGSKVSNKGSERTDNKRSQSLERSNKSEAVRKSQNSPSMELKDLQDHEIALLRRESSEREHLPAEEISPKHEILSLSKILNGYTGIIKKENKLSGHKVSPQNNSDVKPQLNEVRNSNTLITPKKPVELNKENKASKSPLGYVSPLALNLTPATQLQERAMSNKGVSSHRILSFNENTAQIRDFMGDDHTNPRKIYNQVKFFI